MCPNMCKWFYKQVVCGRGINNPNPTQRKA